MQTSRTQAFTRLSIKDIIGSYSKQKKSPIKNISRIDTHKLMDYL